MSTRPKIPGRGRTARNPPRRGRNGVLSRALTLLAALILAHVTQAQVATPPELHGWESWLLYGHENHRCPWLVPGRPSDDDRVCAWPSVLELQVSAQGGRFSQRWEVAADSWLTLPGSRENWPEEVTLDGKPAAVVARERAPALRVTAGSHTVKGAFSWSRRPELLAIPPSVALLDLSIDGHHVVVPQRSSAGITLGAQAVARQDNRTDVRVFRLLDDDLPSLLTTQIHLAIAGEAREIRLPQVLPQGFVPTAVDAPLATRLDPDNTLRVQVRPGEFDLTVQARGPSPLAQVRRGARSAPWPAEEIWSFQAQDRLRVVAIEGVQPTDPAQADVPQEWRTLPAYRMDSGAVLKVSERSRGIATQDANQLQLRRTAWLDFSGAGYTIVDAISGEMRRDWRLEMSAPYALQSVRTEAGEALLVTAGMNAGLTGVEVRQPNLSLTAVSRLPHSGVTLPATGWRQRFTRVSGRLITGPGYRLLAAVGPDAAPDAWLERWRLLDIFAVLLIATVAQRMLGWRIAAIALGALALTYQEAGAPTWLWLNVLLALGLLRAAPAGRLRTWAGAYRLIALALLLFALAPFVITQARLAVYPQLEATEGVVYQAVRMAKKRDLNVPTAAAPALAETATSEHSYVAGVPLEAIVVTAARQTAVTSSYEPGVLVQAGPGLPDWQYHAYDYSWTGPVEAGATARFLISPPWMTRLWRLLGLWLSVVLLYQFVRRDLQYVPDWLRRRPATGIAAMVLALIAASATAPEAQAASTPDPATLSELRTRLLAPPKCAPDCADVLAARVSVTTARLTLVLEVSALDAVGLALPGADPNWTPDLVQVDGTAAGWVYRNARGERFVNVSPGRHVIRLEGPLEGVDSVAIAFPVSPHLMDVGAPGWDVSGLNARTLVSGALQLVRRQVATPSGAVTLRPEEFPAFVRVDRLFHLAHDWTIETTLERVAPKSSPFTVTLPVLAQEAVTSGGLEARQNTVTVGIAAAQGSYAFSSIIPVSDSLELVAANAASYSEHWRFDVGSTWHVDFSGVPAVLPETDVNGWLFEYYPRPGEHLKLSISRPAATPGSTMAFDRVQLATGAGKRSSDSTLELDYRSTQGGRQVLHLPADAEVTAVTSDGTPLPLRPESGELSLAALPGVHRWVVSWQTPTGAKLLTRSAPVGLSAPASNLTESVRLPQDRWVLYAFGPGVGPTVLYWGELLLFIVIAWLIGRSRLTPLATRDWLLLGLGLSTFSWLVFVLFIVFIVVFEWRARSTRPVNARHFNLLQVGLGVLGLAAIFAVVAAVPGGLLAHPDMRIATPYGELAWFIDGSGDQLPRVGVLSVSLWWYKVAMLAWALWLSFALTRWTKWAWQVFVRDGLWRGRVATIPSAPPSPRTET